MPCAWGLSPRVRGNRNRSGNTTAADRGLSPRVRGNRSPDRDVVASTCRVYPRVCGGTEAHLQARRVIARCAPPRSVSARSIPACAGEPRRSCRRAMPWLLLEGLSPRVRGNHHEAVQLPLRGWSIPACAGEPRAGWDAILLRMVVHGRSIPACAGEPLRGDAEKNGFRRGRSIPACAGEPAGSANMRDGRIFYGLSPRVRGNHTSRASMAVSYRVGLSPRVRGNRRTPHTARSSPGLSPRVRGNRHRDPLSP